MPVQAAKTLEQDVHGTQVGDQHIEIHVQGLFQGLGCDKHPGLAVTMSAETFFYRLIQLLTVRARVAGMVGTSRPLHGKEPFSRKQRLQGGLRLSSRGHGISEDQHPSPLAYACGRQFGHGFGSILNRDREYPDGLFPSLRGAVFGNGQHALHSGNGGIGSFQTLHKGRTHVPALKYVQILLPDMAAKGG